MSKQYESRVRRSEYSVEGLLTDEFCSALWLLASYERKRDRRGRIRYCRKKGAYPIPGMIRCCDCGRWSPPWHDDDVCTDCRMQRIVRDLFKRLKRWPRDDWPFLLKMWWRRPVYMYNWLNEGLPHPAVTAEVDLPEPASPEGATDSPFAADDDSPISEADLFDGHLEPDQRWGHTPSSHEMLSRMRRRFHRRYKNKDGEWVEDLKPRGMGCTKVMLPETEKSLQNEIAYFKRRGEVKPWARRLHNPLDRYEYPMPAPEEQGDLWL